MKRINVYLIDVLLSPISSYRGDKYEAMKLIDGNDEKAVRNAIKKDLVPYFNGFDTNSRGLLKRELRCLASMQEPPVDRFFARLDVPFEPPLKQQIFLVWLWEELFSEPFTHLEGSFELVRDSQQIELLKRVR